MDNIEKGLLLLNENNKIEALNYFIECYDNKLQNKILADILLNNYYEFESNKNNYETNIDMLSKYELISHKSLKNFNQLQTKFLRISKSKFAQFNSDFSVLHRIIEFDDNIKIKYTRNTYIFYNEFNLSHIYELYELLREKNSSAIEFYNFRTPIYLFYESKEEFLEYLQILDYESIIKERNIVFIFGYDEFNEYFSDEQSIIPDFLYNSEINELIKIDGKHNDYIVNKLFEIKNFRHNEAITLRKLIDDYYSQKSKKDILDNVKYQPKILLRKFNHPKTVEYTTSNYCKYTFDNLNIENHELTEKSRVSNISEYCWLKEIYNFKPDIIFCVNTLRNDFLNIHENIIFLTWTQDPIDKFFIKKTAENLGHLDFILNLFIDHKGFNSVGYNKENIINVIMPVNHKIFKNYDLTDEEIKRYSADISFVANKANTPKLIEELAVNSLLNINNRYTDIFRNTIDKWMNMTYDLIENDINFDLYSEEYKRMVIKCFEENGVLDLNIHYLDIENFINEMIMNRITGLKRIIPIKWLIDKGYDVKLWGIGWEELEDFKNYTMGYAEQGEELSKIYNASKITLCMNYEGIHERIFQSALSGTLCMQLEPANDNVFSDVRKHLEKDKEIILFNSKDDFYRKIDYFLENEEKRKQVVDACAKKTLSYFTYEAFIKRILSEVIERVEKLI